MFISLIAFIWEYLICWDSSDLKLPSLLIPSTMSSNYFKSISSCSLFYLWLVSESKITFPEFFLFLGESESADWLLSSSSFISKVNTDPYPNSDSTKISPPNSLLIILQMQRPRPIPFLFRFLSLWILQNCLKRFFWSILLIPSPLS